MTVAELKAILDGLPDDMEVLVNHEPHGAHEPELFTSPGFSVRTGLGNKKIPPALIIYPPFGKGFDAAKERSHWQHLQKKVSSS
jgi:hypothetical protein